MAEYVWVIVNGGRVEVPAGATALAAIHRAGSGVCRTSVAGEPRGAVCGMGVCFECRATIDGIANVRTCMARCADGMEIETGG